MNTYSRKKIEQIEKEKSIKAIYNPVAVKSSSSEVEEIFKTVNLFAGHMKDRLLEKAKKGYVGWDGEYPSGKLAAEIQADVQGALDGDPKKCIDIADRAMMLWYRNVLRRKRRP